MPRRLESHRWRHFAVGIIDSMGFLRWNNNRIYEKKKIINIYIIHMYIYILFTCIYIYYIWSCFFFDVTKYVPFKNNVYIYIYINRITVFVFCCPIICSIFFGTCPVTCFQISHDLLGWNVEQSPFCYGKSPCYSWEDSLFHGLFNSLPWKMVHL